MEPGTVAKVLRASDSAVYLFPGLDANGRPHLPDQRREHTWVFSEDVVVVLEQFKNPEAPKLKIFKVLTSHGRVGFIQTHEVIQIDYKEWDSVWLKKLT